MFYGREIKSMNKKCFKHSKLKENIQKCQATLLKNRLYPKILILLCNQL